LPQDEPLVLFLGAGFSSDANLPMGNELRDQAAKRLLGLSGSPQVDTHELGERFYRHLREKNALSDEEADLSAHEYALTWTLEGVVRAEADLAPLDTLPSTLTDFAARHTEVLSEPPISAVASLRSLLEAGRRIAIVTVNFDELVEHDRPDLFEYFVTAQQFANAPGYLDRYFQGQEAKAPLLKVHGTISEPGSCIVSAVQTAQGLPESKRNALLALARPEPPRHCLYIGMSMRDKDLNQTLAQPEMAKGLQELWVTPYLPDSLRTFAAANRTAFWGATEVIERHLVTERAQDFLSTLESMTT